MKNRNLIIVLMTLIIVLGVVYFFASSGKTRGVIEVMENKEKGIPNNSGIKGFVTRGPICPALRPGDENCKDKPVKANLIIKNEKGEIVKIIASLEDGSFSTNLSPGNYVVYSDDSSKNLFGISKPEYVTVEEEKFAEVTIRVDTGIR